MGTRADFYVGRGTQAEWIGSIAWDGYPCGINEDVLEATSEEGYRVAVESFFAERRDVTRPEQGWPWPWENSGTTDYAYAFDEGCVYMSRFGRVWLPATEDEPDEWAKGNKSEMFPDMKDRKNVQLGGLRSGLIVVSARSDGSVEVE